MKTDMHLPYIHKGCSLHHSTGFTLNHETILKIALLVWGLLCIAVGLASVAGLPQIFITTTSRIVTGCVLGFVGLQSMLASFFLQLRISSHITPIHKEPEHSTEELSSNELLVEEPVSKAPVIAQVNVKGYPDTDWYQNETAERLIIGIGQNVEQKMQQVINKLDAPRLPSLSGDRVFLFDLYITQCWISSSHVQYPNSFVTTAIYFDKTTRELHFIPTHLEIEEKITEKKIVFKPAKEWSLPPFFQKKTQTKNLFEGTTIYISDEERCISITIS